MLWLFSNPVLLADWKRKETTNQCGSSIRLLPENSGFLALKAVQVKRFLVERFTGEKIWIPNRIMVIFEDFVIVQYIALDHRRSKWKAAVFWWFWVFGCVRRREREASFDATRRDWKQNFVDPEYNTSKSYSNMCVSVGRKKNTGAKQFCWIGFRFCHSRRSSWLMADVFFNIVQCKNEFSWRIKQLKWILKAEEWSSKVPAFFFRNFRQRRRWRNWF